MNVSPPKTAIQYLGSLISILLIASFSSIHVYSQSSCDYASDPDFDVTMGVTTLYVHGDQCFTMDDKLVVTCIDNNNVPSRDTFNFDNCDTPPPSGDQRTLTISEFSAEVDLSGCSAVEILYPDGSVGYYEIIADENPDPGSDFSGFLNVQFCDDECLTFSVVDAWGNLVGENVPCCVNGEIITAFGCGDCSDMGGICFPEPGECEGGPYGSVDYGCVEIDRSSTRTFYVNACPFTQDDRREVGRNGGGDLNTGIIECYYPDIDNLFDRQALLENHCEIIVHDIQIHAEHLDDMIVKNGAYELPFSLVGDFEFPFTLKRGDNLPFEVKFAPYEYSFDGPEEATVTICYELSDECECNFGPNPDRNQDNSRDGLHCETSKWYDFRVTGYGKDCEEFEGNGECRLKCPECIFTPESIQTNGGGGDGPCGGYFEYTIGYAGPDAPPSPEPTDRGPFYCGDLSLNTVTGQLYIFDEGFGNPQRVPGEGEWIATPPAPYEVGSYELECNQGSKNGGDIPYIPYLFFDDSDAELYLVPGYGQPVEQVDVIVSLENDFNGTRNIGYGNCGDYEPGDVFYIHPETMEVRQNAAASGIAYEFIACDGYRLFAKLVDDMAEPILSCNFYAEFPSTFSMAYYESYTNGGPVKENGCYAWELQYCDLTRTDLLVVHNEADEGYDELICDMEDSEVERPEDPGCNTADFGCIFQGNTIQQSFDLFHCSDISRAKREDNNIREEEMNIDCSSFSPVESLRFGQGCEITIHSIEIVEEYLNDVARVEDNISEHFSLAQPMSFPVNISFEEFEEMLIDFHPTETGIHSAYVVICYENTCSSCYDFRFISNERNGEEAGHCNYEDFVFEIKGCSYEFSNMDEDLDGDLEVVDPCSCGDPQNVYGNPGGTISLFHDFISVGGIGIDQTFDIEVEITQGELYDENNMPLPRLGDNSRIQLNWDPVRGTHFLEFWTEPGVGFGGLIYVNGSPSTDPDAMLLSICDGPCAPIPTLGEWGIIILSMMLLILGLVGLRQPKLKLELLKK